MGSLQLKSPARIFPVLLDPLVSAGGTGAGRGSLFRVMGIDWQQTDLLIGRADRVRCEPNWALRPDWSERLEDFDLWIVWAGKGEMRGHSQIRSLRPGSCFWMRPGGLYEATHDPHECLGVTYIHFDLIDRATGKRIAADQVPTEYHELRHLAYFESAAARVVELQRASRLKGEPSHAERQEETANRLLSALLMDLEAGYGAPHEIAGGQSMRRRQLILDAVSAIHEAPGRWTDINELARRAGYSIDHFTRLFRGVTGMTPRELIIQARMDRARQLLLESSLPVTAIAEALGYENVFFFSRQFKQKNAVSPQQFRSRNARKSNPPSTSSDYHRAKRPR